MKSALGYSRMVRVTCLSLCSYCVCVCVRLCVSIHCHHHNQQQHPLTHTCTFSSLDLRSIPQRYRNGIGETLQTISLLAYLRECRGNTEPHLIIVPKSVVGNWLREFHKWCPSIRHSCHQNGRYQRRTTIIH